MRDGMASEDFPGFTEGNEANEGEGKNEGKNINREDGDRIRKTG